MDVEIGVCEGRVGAKVERWATRRDLINYVRQLVEQRDQHRDGDRLSSDHNGRGKKSDGLRKSPLNWPELMGSMSRMQQKETPTRNGDPSQAVARNTPGMAQRV